MLKFSVHGRLNVDYSPTHRNATTAAAIMNNVMHTASIAGPLFSFAVPCTLFQFVPSIPDPNRFDTEVALEDA